jgi:preprotein translocase subunit SecD
MIIWPKRFNIYFLCLTLLATAAGCRSPESDHKKQLAVLHVYLEVPPDTMGMSASAPIYREHPTSVTVARAPFLGEGDVAAAKVVEDKVGGFALQIQFDQRGTWTLEQYSATNPGKRFAIYAEFGDKMAIHRWLAAPIIARRISDGTLTFTPDATREETEQIVRGLNNVAIKEGNQEKPKAKADGK